MAEQDELDNTNSHSTCIDEKAGRGADPCCLPESPAVAANGSLPLPPEPASLNKTEKVMIPSLVDGVGIAGPRLQE